jgi:DNA (cytosine-5)-methyltransferase 1
MTGAYYNEIDPYAAQWLRNLIAAGHIAPGDVDERSIEDVKPDDLRQYKQCHFFAGIGVWSHSLRRAGWSDDRPVWTGSCPCQPFSDAGKGAGFDDERHLWPSFQWLIQELRPEHIFGEQVASKSADVWFDLVQADLEGMGYTFGLVPYPSAGVGAPHIRDRAYWVAHADMQHKSSARNQTRLANTGWPLTAGRVADTDGGRWGWWEMSTQGGEHNREAAERHQGEHGTECCSETGSIRLADTKPSGFGTSPAERTLQDDEWSSNNAGSFCGPDRLANTDHNRQQPGTRGSSCGEFPTAGNNDRGRGQTSGVANTSCNGWQGWLSGRPDAQRKTEHGSSGCSCADFRMGNTDGKPARGNGRGAHCPENEVYGADACHCNGSADAGGIMRPGPVNGFWRDSDWLHCRDGKWRPVRPQSFPLVNGAPSRVGRLRAYGNAINSDAATAFIESYMEVIS